MKKLLLSLCLIIGLAANACWFTNDPNWGYTFTLLPPGTQEPGADPPPPPPTVEVPGETVPIPDFGTHNVPTQMWMHIKKADQLEPGVQFVKIIAAALQYRKLPSGSWVTFRTLKDLNWDMEYVRPVQLFGPDIFNPPGAQEGDEYIVRLWFSNGLYENGYIGDDLPAGGDTSWRPQWMIKITIGKRRPI